MTIDEFVDRAEHCARLKRDINFHEIIMGVLSTEGRWKEFEDHNNETFKIRRKLEDIEEYVKENSSINLGIFRKLVDEFYCDFGNRKEIADRFKKEFGNER